MIENLTDKHKEIFFNFLNDHWKENHVFVQNEQLFDFQHKLDDIYTFLICREKNKITSILGYIYTNQNCDGIWLAIWKSTDSRGTEGVSLLFNLMSKKNNFIGAIGISETAKNLYSKLKWKIGKLSHMFVSGNPSLNLRIINSDLNKTRYEFSKKFIFPESCNSNFLPFKDHYYYKNRYLNHPVFKYFFLTLLDDNLTFIGRILEYNGFRVFHVVDLIGDINRKNISSSIKYFLNKENFDLFEMMMYDSRRITTDMLFKKEGEIIPTYFSPFLNKNISIELSYKIKKNLPVRFFLGDSDQDRPN